MDQASRRWQVVVAGIGQSRILQTKTNQCIVCTAPELEDYYRSGRLCGYTVSVSILYNVECLTRPLCRHNSLRNTHHISEEIQKSVAAQEVQLKRAITELDNFRPRLKSELAVITAASDPPGDTEEDPEDRPRAVEELHREEAALKCSHNVLEKALAKTEHHTGIKVTNITVDDTGKVLAGLINTQGKYTAVDVMIDNIKATKGGKVIAGVVEEVRIDF